MELLQRPSIINNNLFNKIKHQELFRFHTAKSSAYVSEGEGHVELLIGGGGNVLALFKLEELLKGLHAVTWPRTRQQSLIADLHQR